MGEAMTNGPYRLIGRIQHYAWGGCEFIPALLGFHPKPDTPYAEYWLGAHERAPATVLLNEDQAVSLDRLIADQPEHLLGRQAASRYGRLPYLFKVLDVARPLSIQVHPTQAQAEAGFERENRRGVPLDSPTRNYRDRNHKPELMVALSDFWLLHGFLPEEELGRVLETIPEFHSLRRVWGQGGLSGLYRRVMGFSPAEVEAVLGPLIARLRQTDAAHRTPADDWLLRIAAERPADRGLFSLYFLNLVHLHPGQAIFQAAGVPHAYLQGRNVEVMANSDNVLRGGLTDKHVDVDELLRVVHFAGMQPCPIEAEGRGDSPEAAYPAPAPDFALYRSRLRAGTAFEREASSVEILLLMEGAVTVSSRERNLALQRGWSAVVFAWTTYRVEAAEEADLFRVSVGR